MAKLRGAVFGAGRMGRHHIRIMAQHPDVDLIGVVDPAVDHAKEIAQPFGVPVFSSIEELPDIDVAVVVTPTQFHYETGMALFDRGVHVMMEKPLAENPEKAEELVKTARAKGLKLAVGHVERFNAAVMTLKKLLKDPKHIIIERMSPYTPRIKDSVIYDLTIHDADLANWLAGDGKPIKVEASGGKVFSDTTDYASSVVEFDNGVVVNMVTSRITQDKIRGIRVCEPDRFIVADTLHQTIQVKRQAEVSYEGEDDTLTFAQASVVETPLLMNAGEPLRLEQDNFYQAVLNDVDPDVTGEDGLTAVRLVEQIEMLCK